MKQFAFQAHALGHDVGRAAPCFGHRGEAVGHAQQHRERLAARLGGQVLGLDQVAEGVARGGHRKPDLAQHLADATQRQFRALGVGVERLQVAAGRLLQALDAAEQVLKGHGRSGAVHAGLQRGKAQRVEHLVDTTHRRAHALERLRRGLAVLGQRLDGLGIAGHQCVAVAAQRLHDGLHVRVGVVGQRDLDVRRDLPQALDRQAQRLAVVLRLLQNLGGRTVQQPADLLRHLAELLVALVAAEQAALLDDVDVGLAGEVAAAQEALQAGALDARVGTADDLGHRRRS